MAGVVSGVGLYPDGLQHSLLVVVEVVGEHGIAGLLCKLAQEVGEIGLGGTETPCQHHPPGKSCCFHVSGEISQHAPSKTPGLKGTERSDAGGGVEQEGRAGAEEKGWEQREGPINSCRWWEKQEQSVTQGLTG